MSRTDSFFIPMIPVPKGNAKQIAFGKAGVRRVINPKKVRDAEGNLKAMARQYAPREPYTGPIVLDVVAIFPIPSSKPEWLKRAMEMDEYLFTKRPDREQILKLVGDALEGLFYLDDKQIYDGRIKKRYGVRPGYQIKIKYETQRARI